MSAEERRRHPRIPVDVPVRLTVDGESLLGRLKDICRDAALVESNRAFPLETTVVLAMELPGTGGPLEVSGRVIRLAGEDGVQAMAILFTGVTPAAATRIDFFVALSS